MDIGELDKEDQEHVGMVIAAVSLGDTDNDGKLSKEEFVKMMS